MLNKQEEDFKIKMARMKAFYDKNLKKLNQGEGNSHFKTCCCQLNELNDYHLKAPEVQTLKNLKSHQGLPKVKAHHNINKQEAYENRMKVRDYRVKSASVRTAGIAKKCRTKLCMKPCCTGCRG